MGAPVGEHFWDPRETKLLSGVCRLGSLPIYGFLVILPMPPTVVNKNLHPLALSAVVMGLSKGGCGIVLLLVLSGCGRLPWSAASSQSPVARRRAVSTSQRQEARMARPTIDRTVVDYGAYKQINPGMELAEVQALLGQVGQRHDLVAAVAPEDGDNVARFWRWTHPSGVYNIHVRLKESSKSEAVTIQAKWLTYNPPE